MTNKWVEHVREEAKRLNISYGCAMSRDDVKKKYKTKDATASKVQAVFDKIKKDRKNKNLKK